MCRQPDAARAAVVRGFYSLVGGGGSLGLGAGNQPRAIKTTLFTGKGRKNEESTGIIMTLLLTLGDEFSSKKMEEHRLDR